MMLRNLGGNPHSFSFLCKSERAIALKAIAKSTKGVPVNSL